MSSAAFLHDALGVKALYDLYIVWSFYYVFTQNIRTASSDLSEQTNPSKHITS